MGKIAFQSDVYFNNQNRMKLYGDAACPVDLNAGLVVPKTDKWGMSPDLTNDIEDNIQERFGLQTPNEDEY